MKMRHLSTGLAAVAVTLLAACSGQPASVPTTLTTSSPSAGMPTAASPAATDPSAVRTVTIRKGDSAKGEQGCSSAACAWVLVTTTGFSGSYQCTWWGGHGGDWVSRSYTEDVTDAAYAYYGYSDADVRVTCGGVTSNTINW